MENYGHFLGQNSNKYFHNLCIEFVKTLHQSKDPNRLEIEMEKVINASKQMNWKKEKKSVWKKEDGEKALNRVWSEFSRYVQSLRKKENESNLKELLEALSEVQRLVDALKVT
jgi:hypothetical protein